MEVEGGGGVAFEALKGFIVEHLWKGFILCTHLLLSGCVHIYTCTHTSIHRLTVHDSRCGLFIQEIHSQ